MMEVAPPVARPRCQPAFDFRTRSPRSTTALLKAPEGKYRVVSWHENGVRGGASGRFGDPIEIAGASGTMEIKPTDFDVSPK